MCVALLSSTASVFAYRWGVSSGPWAPVYALDPSFEPNAADIGFVQSMLVHHNQAIQLAWIAKDADSPQVRSLAQNILSAQSQETGLMMGWLSAWGAPQGTVGAPMAWVNQVSGTMSAEDVLYVSRCKANGSRMDGIPTTEQLNAFQQADPKTKSKLFVQLMMAHHQAALDMAGFIRRNGQSALIKGFATSVIKEQRNELAWMQNNLSAI